MKDNLRRLNWCLRLLGHENFYSYGVTRYEVRMQGDFNPNVVKTLTSIGFSFPSVDGNGYIEFRRGIYRVVLTD